MKLLLILGFLSPMSNVFSHDFYVGIMQIEYNEENGSLEIAIKLTGHDLEYVLEKNGAPKLNLGSKDLEAPNADAIVLKYVRENVKFTVDGATKDFLYVGKEVELDDDIWIYLEIKSIKNFNIIEIQNSLLSDYFPKQQNHIHLKLYDKKYSLVLMNGKFTGTIYDSKKGKK